MIGGFEPRVIDELRPDGMGLCETILWEALAAGTQAAFFRLNGRSADQLSPDALHSLAIVDAAEAALPHIQRLAATDYMRLVLERAVSAEAVAAGRVLCSPVEPVGLPA